MAEAKKGTLRNPGKTMRRALKFAARGKGAQPALTHVHLDECGDVVATDSYRMYVEHGAWDGPSIDVPYGRARELSKLKASAESAEVEGGDHGFPDYRKLFRGIEAQAVARVDPKQLLPVLREHARMRNDHVVLAVDGRDLHVQGSGKKGAEPTARFGESCDGAGMRMGFNPKYLADALGAMPGAAEVRMASPVKPAAVVGGDIEVLVMPVRLDAEPKRGGFKKAQPSPEPKGSGAPLDLGGECVCITGTLAGMTRSEAFTRLKLAGATPSEGFTKKVTVLAVAANAGKSKREKAERAIANGQAVRIVSGSELVAALMEQGRTAMEKRTVSAAKDMADAEAAAKATGHADVAAVAMEPRKKGEADMGKRIEELERELAMLMAEAEPKEPEPPAGKVEDVAVVVTLDYMRQWCRERENVVATQKREGCPIWVEGDTKSHMGELKGLGFRWAPKRKGWYFKVA